MTWLGGGGGGLLLLVEVRAVDVLQGVERVLMVVGLGGGLGGRLGDLENLLLLLGSVAFPLVLLQSRGGRNRGGALVNLDSFLCDGPVFLARVR